MNIMDRKEKAVSAEVHPSVSRGFFDYVKAKCVMHFPTEPDYEFTFFDDEISFSVGELVGKTAMEANELYMAKDKAYLQAGL